MHMVSNLIEKYSLIDTRLTTSRCDAADVNELRLAGGRRLLLVRIQLRDLRVGEQRPKLLGRRLHHLLRPRSRLVVLRAAAIGPAELEILVLGELRVVLPLPRRLADELALDAADDLAVVPAVEAPWLVLRNVGLRLDCLLYTSPSPRD